MCKTDWGRKNYGSKEQVRPLKLSRPEIMAAKIKVIIVEMERSGQFEVIIRGRAL